MKLKGFFLSVLLCAQAFAQQTIEKQKGSTDTKNFRKMYDILVTPNMYSTVSAASLQS